MEQATLYVDSIEQLYVTYRHPICRHIERLVHDREAAEDLAQDTFIKALLHVHGVTTASALRRWLYRIATNTAYDYLRRRRIVEIAPLADWQKLPTEGPTLETRVDDAEPVRVALQHIPAHYRVPLLLNSAGYNHRDIASALGIKANTIKTRIHRARVQFRHHYVA